MIDVVVLLPLSVGITFWKPLTKRSSFLSLRELRNRGLA